MRTFLQGRLDLVQALKVSQLPVTYQDLALILTTVISACAAWRWPGKGFDQKRFVESLIQFSSPSLHLDYISIGALLNAKLITESQTPWGASGQGTRIFTGDEIDCSLEDMSGRFPQLGIPELKSASYANLLYCWMRCGYSHSYCANGNTTHIPPTNKPAQISYIGRGQKCCDGDEREVTRVACFNLDYLIAIAQEQVSRLADEGLQKPKKWWFEPSEIRRKQNPKNPTL